MRVGVVGSRECGELLPEQILRHIPENCTIIVSGGARGIDALAEQAARLRGIPLLPILPDYKADGGNAPLIRNARIVRESDLVLAFWDYHSRGTAHVIATCIERGVPVRVIGFSELCEPGG